MINPNNCSTGRRKNKNDTNRHCNLFRNPPTSFCSHHSQKNQPITVKAVENIMQNQRTFK